MTKRDGDVPELVRAAQALEDELVKLEALSRSARKIHLDSDRNIGRAARELNEALALPERLAEGLHGLARAMEAMQVRQQAALEPLSTCAADIRRRMQALGEHMQAFAALGKAAADTVALLQSPDSGSAPALEQAEAQLTSIAEGARSLLEATRADDFPEVAREAEALKQRVSALRGRLKKS